MNIKRQIANKNKIKKKKKTAISVNSPYKILNEEVGESLRQVGNRDSTIFAHCIPIS